MVKDINSKTISVLVCFEGKNRKIEINPKKAEVNAKAKSFTYKALYKADNGKSYMVSIKSINGSNGAKADVLVTNRSGKQTIAERHDVSVRFYRYIF
jgi:hypothetical protein